MNLSFFKSLLLKKTPVSASLEADTTDETDNPYLNARRAWNSHVGGLMSSLRLWQTIGIIGLLMGLAAIGGMVHVASQSKFIPLVFQEDKDGNRLSVTRADQLPPVKAADYRTAVADFITHIRLVTPDVDVQRKAVLQTYAYLNSTDPAAAKASEYLNGSKEVNPFNRATTETVSVEIHSVLQQSKDSWQIDWLEITRDRTGLLKSQQKMRALVTLYQRQPDSALNSDQLLQNPHFIFVRDFDWSKQI